MQMNWYYVKHLVPLCSQRLVDCENMSDNAGNKSNMLYFMNMTINLTVPKKISSNSGGSYSA